MRHASVPPALAIALAIQVAACAPRPAMADTPAVAAAHASFTATLDRALDRRDPVALADTTLPRLAALDAAGRARLAARLASWDIGARVAAYAFLQVCTPYQLGPLGEEAPPDTDPVIEFKTTDCAVLNLVSAALAHVRDAGGERAAMAIANYRGGQIGYATRFHFTTDRLDSSAYYRDITRRVAGPACRHRVVTLNLRADGRRWIPIDWSRKRELFYVPRSLGARFGHWYVQGRIPAAMGVAFVEEGKLDDGLDVVHESLLWKGRVFLHASSRTGRVVTLPWPEFLAGAGRRYDGFVLFEYR
jgi:hypothetical protein